jgi:TolB-like protein
MISSTSSSSRRTALAALLVWSGIAVAQAPQGLAVPEGRRPSRVLVLPLENLVGGPIPGKEMQLRIERMAAMAGADVISGEPLDEYLARYRIRYTGGVDPVAARAARDDLGADAILVTSVLLLHAIPPRFGLTLRLVAAGDVPIVLWMDGVARSGDQAPGLFNLGLVLEPEVLQAEVLNALTRSLDDHLAGRAPRGPACPDGGWFLPRVTFRARPDVRDATSVVVLPFVNQTNRRSAGEVVALEVSRQFAASPGFRLVEPGTVRDEILRRRIVMEDGVSIDEARVLSATLDADLVVAGYVFDYEDSSSVPSTNFTVMVIDRKTGRVVWKSTSYNKGTDSETLFGLRTVGTAPDLACRMVRGVLDVMNGSTGLPGK